MKISHFKYRNAVIDIEIEGSGNEIASIEIDGKNVPLSDGGIVLSNGDSGYVEYFRTKERSFNEERDYLYPIPTEDRSTNPNLKQNPGWKDGLSEGTSDTTDNGMN